MKLPKELPARLHSACESYQEDYAAIVRDCAKVLVKRMNTILEIHAYSEPDTNATVFRKGWGSIYEELDEQHEAILSRYGLEEKA